MASGCCSAVLHLEKVFLGLSLSPEQVSEPGLFLLLLSCFRRRMLGLLRATQRGGGVRRF